MSVPHTPQPDGMAYVVIGRRYLNEGTETWPVQVFLNIEKATAWCSAAQQFEDAIFKKYKNNSNDWPLNPYDVNRPKAFRDLADYEVILVPLQL